MTSTGSFLSRLKREYDNQEDPGRKRGGRSALAAGACVPRAVARMVDSPSRIPAPLMYRWRVMLLLLVRESGQVGSRT